MGVVRVWVEPGRGCGQSVGGAWDRVWSECGQSLGEGANFQLNRVSSELGYYVLSSRGAVWFKV